ncbi:glycosyltransferase family 4 protein [Waterburya agarophytonicola K14]|uniref:Glycosyltransferase family 4 protein n=1 Tax=Waterburya agarophytonicola KI4 TaxID=2874699 RepID=A0A964FFY8_9CYAN|nr:glycosyltransferase family 1 protein [Waterburya agarophytonicola]MCC0177597.1 glycosyltransferase family 4 protein [Waterburya agarophytonicola KI4]
MSSSLLINLTVLFDKPTGIATYARNTFKSFSSLNPTLLSSQKLGNFFHYAVPDDMTPAQGSRGHFKRLLWTQFKLPQIYQKLKANLIYSPIPEAPLYNECRYVVMCHDLIPLRFPRATSPLTNYFRYVVPQVLKQAKHIICNSEATAKDIVDFYGINSDKITPILLGYDRDNFYPRKESFFKIENPYFLYLGRQDTYKNLKGLINAFAAIPNKEYYLAIAGSKDLRFTPKLEQQIKELKLEDRVVLLDYLDYQELPIVMSKAIALVFPTFWEGFGLPVLEAMACGTPVITSNLASLPEITGDAAILIDPYNTAAITSAMIEIGRDGTMRSQLSQWGIQQAQNFSWHQTGAATKEVLERYI